MPIADLDQWLEENSRRGVFWFVKRLSANDTLATKSHQAGPYIPKEVVFKVFPSLQNKSAQNPDRYFQMAIDSHFDVRTIRVVWYNNKLFNKGTRDEIRFTGFGGASSPLLDPESTGALTIFAFTQNHGNTECHAWVCRHETEEDLVEASIGTVEPSEWRTWSGDGLFNTTLSRPTASCDLAENDLPSEWLQAYPSGQMLIEKATEMQPCDHLSIDARLLKRRDCEFALFQSLERAIEMPHIQKGFASIDEFLGRAQTILQRRKARSGKSLELHVRQILLEEHFEEGKAFAFNPSLEGNKKPDFIFPSQKAYEDKAYPPSKLRMLAVKTTCKDRWRQILNEAARVEEKHLLTLQEGVSENQFREMREAKVKLVVPDSLHTRFPKSIQPKLQTLESFLGDVRLLSH